MPTIRPDADLTFNFPDFDGRKELWGYGYDWLFQAEREDRPTDPSKWIPTWALNNTTIIPGLDILTLAGYAVPGNMVLADWSFASSTQRNSQGLSEDASDRWRLERPSGRPRVDYLSWPISSAGSFGRAVSSAAYHPNAAFRLVEFAPPEDEGDAAYTAVEFLGGHRIWTMGYRIYLPVHTGSGTNRPILYRGAPGNWEAVDECNTTATGLQTVEDEDFKRRVIWIEYVKARIPSNYASGDPLEPPEITSPGVFVIWMSGMRKPWIYEIPTQPGGYAPYFYEPQIGPVAVEFGDHAAMVNVKEITWAPTGDAEPFEYLRWDPRFNDIPAPGYTTSHDEGGGTVSVADAVDAEGRHRPKITLTGSPNSRPLVYVVHQHQDPTFSADRTLPNPMSTRAATLKGSGDDYTELRKVTWNRGLYRNWRMTAEIADVEAYWVGELTPNQQVDLTIGWDTGPDWTMMRGYVTQKPELDPAVRQGESATITVQAADWIMTRGAKHYMVHPCSPEGWDLRDWVAWWLKRAGFNGVFTGVTGVQVARNKRKELAWDFSHRTNIVQGIDQVLKAHDFTPLQVTVNGALKFEREPKWTSGDTPDWTLDESTKGDDQIQYLGSEFDYSQMANWVGVGTGGRFVYPAWDLGSIQTPADDDFIGDDWQRIEVDASLSVTQAQARAQQILEESMRGRQLVRWTRESTGAYKPGDFVKVITTGVGIPANSVFKVLEDQGTMDFQDWIQSKSSAIGEIVEVGA
jgi:hypothetical protein